MKYFLIAGEASGDLHGSNLMAAIVKQDPQAQFEFFGGDKMLAVGGECKKHYREMAFMGFIEVLFNLKAIFKNIKDAKKSILSFSPDVLILIDYPGFNLRLAKFAKLNGLKVHYYISPKVWAWKESRVKKIKAYVDKLITIFPFETEFYKGHNFQVDYVGNPLLDSIENWKTNNPVSLNYEKPVLALLPGSRKMELENMLPNMLKAAAYFTNYQIVIAGTSVLGNDAYQFYLKGLDIEVDLIFDKTYELLSIASIGLVTSGTATLETALFKVPQVVCYKANAISIAIARLLIKIKFISLVNLVEDKEIVKELIQNDFNVERLVKELKVIESGVGRDKMLSQYDELYNNLGGIGASKRAAEVIIKDLA